MPIEACVACVNGVLVELCCVDYHVTSKGWRLCGNSISFDYLDGIGLCLIKLLINTLCWRWYCHHGVPWTQQGHGELLRMSWKPRIIGDFGFQEYCSLFRGQVKVIEDKAVDDGFTEAYLPESNVTGLRVLLVLQVRRAWALVEPRKELCSFKEIPGAHAVSSFAMSPDGKNLIYVTNSSTICRSIQWETADVSFSQGYQEFFPVHGLFVVRETQWGTWAVMFGQGWSGFSCRFISFFF